MIAPETIAQLRAVYTQAFYQIRQIRRRHRETIQKLLDTQVQSRIEEIKKNLRV